MNVNLKCPDCGADTVFTGKKPPKAKRCEACKRLRIAAGVKKSKEKLTPERRSEIAKHASSKADKKLAVRRQWDSIKSNKVKYEEVCAAKVARMQKVWAEYGDQKKEDILKKLIQSKPSFRSKLCKVVKAEMEKAGITGFKSEEYFHGYFPDEINHELKIIVEVNGDYFHCNPRLDEFQNGDKYLTFLQCKVKDRWEHDAERLAIIKSFGYDVVTIWESDWNERPKQELHRIVKAIAERTK